MYSSMAFCSGMEREYILPLSTVYLSGHLTAFNFEELCISSDYEKLYLYIYYVEKDIQLYIIYGIKGASWDIFSSESIMFISLPLRRRLRWSAGATGQSSPNRVPAPHSRNVTSRTPQNFGDRVALPGRRWICGPLFSLDSLLERPDANGPGLLRAGPSGEERAVYTTSHGARLSSVPSGDRSANPASVPGYSHLQRALLSVSSVQKLAELGGSPPLRRSLEQLDRPSPAGPLLQGNELAALSTPEASLKRLVPLVGHLAVWEPLPSVSHWVLPEQTLVL